MELSPSGRARDIRTHIRKPEPERNRRARPNNMVAHTGSPILGRAHSIHANRHHATAAAAMPAAAVPTTAAAMPTTTAAAVPTTVFGEGRSGRADHQSNTQSREKNGTMCHFNLPPVDQSPAQTGIW